MAKKEAAKKTGPIKARTLDFSDVKEGGGGFRPKRKPEGDYRAVIAKVDEGKSKSGNDQWIFTIQLTSDKSATYGYYCQFAANQVFKIFNLVVAAGMKAPKSKISIDPKKLVGREIGVRLEDDEYEGKPKSAIDTVFPVSELTDEQDGEDEPDEDEEDEDEEDTEDESEDEDTDEEESDEEDEDDEEEEEDDSDEEEDEDEEDEEPEPVVVKKGKKGKKGKVEEKPVKKATPKVEAAKKDTKAKKATKKGKKSIDLDDL